MIRFLNAYFPRRTLLLGISEACLVALAFVAAAIARLGANDATLMLSYEQGGSKIFVVSAVFIACMYYFDLYDTSILSNRREVLSRLVSVFGVVCILLALIYFVYPPLELGRGIFGIGLALVAVILLLWRRLFLAVNNHPQFAERVLLFGDSPLSESLIAELSARPELGMRVVGQLKSCANGKECLRLGSGEKLRDQLLNAIEPYNAERIIVAMNERRGNLPVQALLQLKSRGVSIQDGTEVYEQITGKIPIESLCLGTLLFSSGFHLSRFLEIYKRLSSIAVSIVGLVLSLPLLPFIALAIKLTSPGRLLHHQERVGRDDTVFYCHKFRTMRADAEADTGPTWAGDDDPRITPVGHFLRTARLDEIPQLWNVLKGEMSLVGPRPERPEFIETLKQEIPYYSLRHAVRPGITGWAQVRYKYGSSVEDAKEKLRYDLFYIKNLSPGLDSLIVFHTVKIILLGRGAK